MHDIEPYYHWRDYYVASEDENSPFYGREYSEFVFTNRIYNYCIHPQWDEFGSATLYMKLLFAEYDEGFAILEFIGEWNDCLQNDIMFLKRNIADILMEKGINKFILIADNLLNFHAGEDDYYEEWFEEVAETEGWIALLNTRNHVEDEMRSSLLHQYIRFGLGFNEFNWRKHDPQNLFKRVESLVWTPNGQLPA